MNERTNQPKTFEDWAAIQNWEVHASRGYKKIAEVAWHDGRIEGEKAATAAAQVEIAGLRLNLQSVVKRSETNDEAYRAVLRAKDEEIARLRDVCDEIMRIMETYHGQDKRGRVDTPGGLEHMGDVWSLFAKWEHMLLTAQAEKEKP